MAFNFKPEKKKHTRIFGSSLSLLAALSLYLPKPSFPHLFSPDLLFSGKLLDRRKVHSQARVPATLVCPWFDGLHCRATSKQPREPGRSSRLVVAPVTLPPPLTPSSSRSACGAARRVDLRRRVFKEP